MGQFGKYHPRRRLGTAGGRVGFVPFYNISEIGIRGRFKFARHAQVFEVVGLFGEVARIKNLSSGKVSVVSRDRFVIASR